MGECYLVKLQAEAEIFSTANWFWVQLKLEVLQQL